jgi:hypothetical protein
MAAGQDFIGFCTVYCCYLEPTRSWMPHPGCYYGHFFVGAPAMAYANDLVLLSPSAFAMRQMLVIFTLLSMRVNLSVLRFLLYRYLRGQTVFHVGHNSIENTQLQWLHLGYMLTSELNDHTDIARSATTLHV